MNDELIDVCAEVCSSFELMGASAAAMECSGSAATVTFSLVEPIERAKVRSGVSAAACTEDFVCVLKPGAEARTV
jgi:hypothetical protein